MNRSKTLKRVAALMVTLGMVILTNVAISLASGIGQLPDSPRPVTLQLGVSELPDSPIP